MPDGTSSSTPIDTYTAVNCPLDGQCFTNDPGSVSTPAFTTAPGVVADNAGGVIFGWENSQSFTPPYSGAINFQVKIGHAQGGSITNTAIVATNTNSQDTSQGPGGTIWYPGPTLLNGNGNVIVEGWVQSSFSGW